MTFPNYLDRLQKANPRLFAAREIKMTPSAFIEQVQRAYQAGEAEARGAQLFSELFPPLPNRGGMDREQPI
jgi:hypothetical protein